MLWFTIKISIMSIVFILIVHNIISFLCSTLTVPKVKNLALENEKYKHMYNSGLLLNNDTQSNNSGYTSIDLLPPVEEENVETQMKNELKSFLKTQLTTN